ncbi:MAG: nucleoside-diphosphate sugar epimerase/dehydratase, partial [Paraperlucidibaca sp.]
MPTQTDPCQRNWLQRLHQGPRRVKQLILLCIDSIALPIIVLFAFYLRIGEWHIQSHELIDLPLIVGSGLLIAYGVRVYSAVVRAFDEHFIQSAMLASVLWIMFLWALPSTGLIQTIPRSVMLMSSFFWLMHLWLSRALIRAVITELLQRSQGQTRVLIYGAGSAGRQLASAMSSMGEYRVLGFVDDDPDLQAIRLHGLLVWPGSRIGPLLRQQRVDEVILAMPVVGRARRREIVDSITMVAKTLKVRVRMLPGIEQMVQGELKMSDVREVDIEELLGRDPIAPNLALFRHHVADRVVMVTGAAGSIGSELCRQLLTATPTTLVLLDHNEYGLYAIERELCEAYPEAKIIAILGSVLDQPRLVRVLQRFGVETLYHAAAYKHVPMVEANPFEGVINNACGTYRTAMAAREAGVKTFVLVSTDKAVRPTNVMGASKRLSELVLQALAAEPVASNQVGTCFSMVRFGNVLCSSGSVVPMFRQQLAEGGPITVTHPDITRYFMTIPEAAQLVIQAGGMAQGGEVFLLEMGEAVRIVDLARQMIKLSGFTERTTANPEGDIEITFIGLRPG